MAKESVKYNRYLNLKEVQKRLNISYEALRVLIFYEEAIPYKQVGKFHYIVRESDLEAYIARIKAKSSVKQAESPTEK